MAEFAQAQQAAVDGVSKIGIQAIFVCHLPSSITAPDGLLLTTYDQPHSQLTKADTTVYAFPAFGAAQSVMRALSENGQTSSVIYECHANAGLRLLPKSSISVVSINLRSTSQWLRPKSRSLAALGILCPPIVQQYFRPFWSDPLGEYPIFGAATLWHAGREI